MSVRGWHRAMRVRSGIRPPGVKRAEARRQPRTAAGSSALAHRTRQPARMRGRPVGCSEGERRGTPPHRRERRHDEPRRARHTSAWSSRREQMEDPTHCEARTAGRCRTSGPPGPSRPNRLARSEEHTSELQSRSDLVCRLLLEKKKNTLLHTTGSKKKKINYILNK